MRGDAEQEVVLKLAADPVRLESTAEVAANTGLIHRHIVRVLDQGQDQGFAYLVMERLRGRTLRELIDDPAFTADLTTRIDLIAQLCLGLHCAHEQQIVHGNLRPENAFITEDGVTKILNFATFGATSPNDRTIISDNALAGSFEYMSPEQIIGRDALDGRSDVFSAGVLLYEFVAGRRPFQGASTTATLARILRDEPAPLDVPGRLNAILKRALDKEPDKRFASAQELAYALWMIDLPDTRVDEDVEGESADSETMFADAQAESVPGDAEPSEEGGLLASLKRGLARAWRRDS
jgi:serine/threonine-protein kinase